MTVTAPPATQDAVPERTGLRSRAVRGELYLLLFGFVLLWLCYDVVAAGDSRHRWSFLRTLMEKGAIKTTKYPAIGPLCAVPLMWLDQLLGWGGWLAVRFNLVLFGVAQCLFYRLLEPLLGTRASLRFLLMLLVGSMFLGHLCFFNSEPMTALCVALGVAYACLHGRRAGWLAVVVGVANTPAAVPSLGLLVARRFWQTRRWQLAWVLVAVVAVICADMFLRYGRFGSTGYENDYGLTTVMPYSGKPGFSYPFVFGVLAITMSFGKGLLFFAPGLLLWPSVRRGRMPAQITELMGLWLVFLVGLVLVYAKWWAWHGGRAWGPRFLLFASIPAALAMVLALERRDTGWKFQLATAAIVLWSAWVGISGGVFHMCGLSDAKEFEHLIWFTPEFSVLFRPFVAMPELTVEQIALLAYCALVGLFLALPTLWLGAREGACVAWRVLTRPPSRA